jgi:lysyl-tRNA synthetase class 2
MSHRGLRRHLSGQRTLRSAMPYSSVPLQRLLLRRPAAGAVAALGLESVVYGLAGHEAAPGALSGLLGALVAARVATLVLGLTLLALTPRMWRGTRTAVGMAILALVALAALDLARGRYAVGALQAGLALALVLGRGAFPLGCAGRPRRAMLVTTIVAWSLAAAALAAAEPRLGASWSSVIEVLLAGALAISVLALRSLLSPAAGANGHREHEYRAARAIIDAHGSDSLVPFLIQPGKALAFAAGGVLSYRVIGGTAVVSADPVAPEDGAPRVLAAFQEHARQQGWRVVVWGASGRHLDAYRTLGLRALCAGEEAFVDPASFTLEGRSVRKLRQSVHRVQRRGWEIVACDGRDVGPRLEREIEGLAKRWRAEHPRLHGFAMGMGEHSGELGPDDLYLLARSPEGELGAVMRFVACANNLSLDTMQRVGEPPNGLNEALVAHALTVARQRGVTEVSLNYAGLAHLVRKGPSRNRLHRALTTLVMAPLHRRFQMDRLVRFNEKFSPEWRPRYLLYESRASLPEAILRVLQAEGYVPEARRPGVIPPLPRILAPGPRRRRALGQPR